MNKIEEGGAAFPTDGPYNGHTYGMSLRDWFAGQALAGYIAAHADPAVDFPAHDDAAAAAYLYADAMLAERK